MNREVLLANAGICLYDGNETVGWGHAPLCSRQYQVAESQWENVTATAGGSMLPPYIWNFINCMQNDNLG